VTLTKRVKGLFNLGLFKKPNREQMYLLQDVGDMTLGMIEFLLRDEWRTKKQYLESIDAFLSFESKTFNYIPTLKYDIGHMIDVSNMIYLQHQIVDLKKHYPFTEKKTSTD
jgi:hypothetical protein